MKVSELVEKLQTMQPDADVLLCDSNRMAYEASGEPSGEGLYYDFDVSANNESFFSGDDEDEENPLPTVVFHFETDYEEKQNLISDLESEIKEFENN